MPQVLKAYRAETCKGIGRSRFNLVTYSKIVVRSIALDFINIKLMVMNSLSRPEIVFTGLCMSLWLTFDGFVL